MAKSAAGLPCGAVAGSPIAQTLGAVVCSRSLTLMHPRSVSCISSCDVFVCALTIGGLHIHPCDIGHSEAEGSDRFANPVRYLRRLSVHRFPNRERTLSISRRRSRADHVAAFVGTLKLASIEAAASLL